MKCGRVVLCDRRSVRGTLATGASGSTGVLAERPRRYCQRRMVDPMHEEDPRWAEAALERFRCDYGEDTTDKLAMADSSRHDSVEEDDLVLTVLNLKFPGHHSKSKYTRSCFKYKMLTSEPKQNSHRMFVKQIVEHEYDANSYDEISSQVDCKFHEYVTDILNESNPSRSSTPVSEKLYQDSIVQHPQQQELLAMVTDFKENSCNTTETTEEDDKETRLVDDAKTTVKYQNTGKRRSLTISRAQSPETVQVIRVDVVCNYSGRSSVSSNISGRKSPKPELSTASERKSNLTHNSFNGINFRSPFVNRYILTNSIKQLDQSVGGGEKVTLLCKTFKLTTRSQKPKSIMMEQVNKIGPTKKIACRKEKKNKKSSKLLSEKP